MADAPRHPWLAGATSQPSATAIALAQAVERWRLRLASEQTTA